MKNTSNKKLIFKSWSYLRKYLGSELIIFVFILLGNIGILSFPYFYKIIIDDIFPSKDMVFLIQILLLMVGLQIFSALIGICSTYLQQKVSNQIMEDIQTDLFEHVIHLPISFYDKNNVGEIVHSLSNEVNVVRSFLTTSFIFLLNNCILIVGILLVLLWMDPFLCLVSVGLIPVLLITISVFHARLKAYISKDREADAAILSFMIERLQNVLAIKLFNQHGGELQRLKNTISRYIKLNLRVTLYSVTGNNFSIFIISMAPIIVIGFGSQNIFAGIMSLGTLIAFLQYFQRLIGPSQHMIGLYYSTLRAQEAMNKIMSFFDSPIPDAQLRSKEISTPIEKITLKDVALTFDKNPILNKINLEFYSGKSYGFVGESGSGKSTITFLLCGLYLPTKGSIHINDQSTTDLGVYAINERVSLVRSNTKLLSGTIKEHVLYGNKEASDESISAVLKTVEMFDFINNLPDKLATNISDIGTKLSDGQRQRLSIARALLRNTDVLILDEATSAMDSINESRVIENILELYKDKILVVISHRLSSIKGFDEIVCIEDGVVVEQNDHETLIDGKGTYWKLFEKQLLAE